MSRNRNLHVTPHPNGGWQVKGADNLKATVRTKTQAEAYIATNEHSEVIAHGQNGRIREKNLFGSDPFSPKGQYRLLIL